jgi:hypothetical protein
MMGLTTRIARLFARKMIANALPVVRNLNAVEADFVQWLVSVDYLPNHLQNRRRKTNEPWKSIWGKTTICWKG